MIGMNNQTGQALGGIDHLKQSIADILTTRLGSRVERRTYGSNLFKLIDAPLNRETISNFYAATADALKKWEPRIAVTQVKIVSADIGQVTIDLYGTYLPDGAAVTLSGVVIQ